MSAFSLILAVLLATASLTSALTEETVVAKIASLHQSLSDAVSLDQVSLGDLRELIKYYSPTSSFLSYYSLLWFKRQYDNHLIQSLLDSENIHETQFGAILLSVYPTTSSNLVINLLEAAKQFNNFTPNYHLILSRMKSSHQEQLAIEVCDRFLSNDDSIMESNFIRGSCIRTFWDLLIENLSASSIRTASICLSLKLTPFWWTSLFESLIRDLMPSYEGQIGWDNEAWESTASRQFFEEIDGALNPACDKQEYFHEVVIRCWTMNMEKSHEIVFQSLMGSHFVYSYFDYSGSRFLGKKIQTLLTDHKLTDCEGRIIAKNLRKSFRRFFRHLPNDLWLLKRLAPHSLAAQDPELFSDCWSIWDENFLKSRSDVATIAYNLRGSVTRNMAESHQILMKKPSIRYCEFYSAFGSAKEEIAADFVWIAWIISELQVYNPSKPLRRRMESARAALNLLNLSLGPHEHFNRNLLDVVLGALPAISEQQLTEVCFGVLNHPLFENSQFTMDQLSEAAARIHNIDDQVKIFSAASNLPEFAELLNRRCFSGQFSWGFCKRMSHSSRQSLLPLFPQYSIFLDPVRHFRHPEQDPSIPEPIFNNRDFFELLLSYRKIEQDLILPWMTCLMTSPFWASTADNCVILLEVIGSSRINSETYLELLSVMLHYANLAADLDSRRDTLWNLCVPFIQSWFSDPSADDLMLILNKFPEYNLVLNPMQIFHQPEYESFIEQHIHYPRFFDLLESALPSLNPEQILPTAILMIQSPIWDNSEQFDDLFRSIVTLLDASSPSYDLSGLLAAILQNPKAVSRSIRGLIVSPLRRLLLRLFDQLSGDQQKAVCDTCPRYTRDLLARVRPFKITQDNLESVRNFVTNKCGICLDGMLDRNGEPVPVEDLDDVKLEICSLHFCEHFLHLDCVKGFMTARHGALRCPVCRTDIEKLVHFG